MNRIEVFSAPWCGPCKLFKGNEVPKLETAGVDIVVYDIETDDGQAKAKEAGVRGIPTIKVYKSDELVKTFVGMTKAEQILGEIEG